MQLLQGLAVAEVHVDAAGQARVEAAHRPHDVHALEVVRPVLLEDGHVLNRVLVGPGRAEAVAGAAVPRRRRVRVVVGDHPVLDHHVVGERAAHRLVEAAADRLVGHLEGGEHLDVAAAAALQPLLDEVQGHRRGVGDEVHPGPVALQRVGPPRDLPLQRGLRQLGAARQRDLHAVPGRLDVGRVHQPGQRGGVEPGERPAPGVEREVVAGARVQPARAHHPAVAVVEVPLARLGQRRLVPGVADVDRVAQRVVGDERVLVDPVAVEGAAQQDADAEVDVDEVVGQQLAVDHDARGDVHRLAPVVHRLVAVVADLRVLERAPAAEQDPSPADLLVPRQCLVEEVEHVVVHGDRAS